MDVDNLSESAAEAFQNLTTLNQLFYEGIIAGKSPAQAYLDAGGSSKNPARAARKILQAPRYSRFIALIEHEDNPQQVILDATTNTRPVGRPTAYNEDYNSIVRSLCLLGATDEMIADALGTSVATINVWKTKYPKFLESLKGGKIQADGKVALALYQRAIGYAVVEQREETDSQGNKKQVKTIKKLPPDTTAGIFFLKNRQPALWGDKREIALTNDSDLEVSGEQFAEMMDALGYEPKNNTSQLDSKLIDSEVSEDEDE